MRPITDLSLWYAFKDNPGHSPMNGLGPELTNLRQSTAVVGTIEAYHPVIRQAGESRFYHAGYPNNLIAGPALDLTDPLWIRTNMPEPTTGHPDPTGGSSAWELKDDGTLGNHQVTIVLGNELDAFARSVWVRRGTSRYMIFSTTSIPTATRTMIWDFDIGDWAYTDVYYLGPSTASLYSQWVYDRGDGWFELVYTSAVSVALTEVYVTIGLTSGPVPQVDEIYAGIGDTAYIWHPVAWRTGTEITFGRRGWDPDVEYDTKTYNVNHFVNSMLIGASNGVPPDSDNYDYVWQLPAGQTGTGTSVTPAIGAYTPNPWFMDKTGQALLNTSKS